MDSPFKDDLAKAERQGRMRKMKVARPLADGWAIINGQQVINLGSNDYLGLSKHPAVIASAIECAQEYGWGAGGSRLITGNAPIHAEFEKRIAAFLKKPAALFYSSGFAANTGVITALMRHGGAVFADRLSHASILDGAMWSGAKLFRFAHNDPGSLEKLLVKHSRHKLKVVVTEGIFSMDGDIAPVKELGETARRYGALFMVDDAHGIGVFGESGGGVVELSGAHELVDIHIITLGKAFGGMGGVVAASGDIIEGLVNFSRPFIYSTGAPPIAAACGLAALEIIQGLEGMGLRGKLNANIQYFACKMNELGYNFVTSQSHIIPVRWDGDLVEAGKRLVGKGVFAPGIRPPTVPAGSQRFRVSVTAAHDLSAMGQAAGAFGDVGAG